MCGQTKVDTLKLGLYEVFINQHELDPPTSLSCLLTLLAAFSSSSIL